MIKINKSLFNLCNDNSFYNISNIIKEFKKNNPNANILSLGVGDVSRPIVKPVLKGMHEAVDDLGDMKTFKGYGYSYGHDFLKNKILEEEYNDYNFTLDELYISKSP